MASAREIYARRLVKVREAMREHNVDGLILTNLEEEKVNIRYLTGFTGSSAVCVVTQDRQIFITDGRYASQSAKEVRGWDIRVGDTPIFDAVDAVKESGVVRLGLVAQEESWQFARDLQEKIEHCTLIPLPNVFSKIRSIKDEREVMAIKNTVVKLEKMLQILYKHVKPGVSDRRLSAQLLSMFAKRGAGTVGDYQITVSGAHSAFIHGNPFELPFKRIKEGDSVQFDVWCKVKGYFADISRVVVCGKATEEQRRMHRALLEAIGEAAQYYRAGVATRQAASRANEVLGSYGYPAVPHGLGHGIGLEVHEAPGVSVRETCTDIFEVGNIVTIEPGIYIPGYGGMRIERDVLITGSGPVFLDELSADLVEL